MENPNLSDEPVLDPADFVLQEQRRPVGVALNSLEDDPEKAARAGQLAQASGIAPALVYGNLENFEVQQKAALTSRLLNDNKFLADYVDSNPMAAKVSNDDYGQLDMLSEAFTRLNANGMSVLGAAVQGFKSGFDAEQFGDEVQKLHSMVQKNILPGHVLQPLVAPPITAAGAAVAGGIGLISGAVVGASAAFAERYKQVAGLIEPDAEAQANRLLRDLIIWADVTMPEAVRGLASPKAMRVEYEKQIVKELTSSKAQEVWQYIRNGKEPPFGVHPITDKLHQEQLDTDLKALSETLKEAQRSATRERDPELFANFIRQHSDREIGISAEAVRRIYGEDIPQADDGKLGFVPRLADQLALAELGGGDIQVPLADWIAKVEPEIARELHDDIRVRPGSVTKNEVKQAGEVRKVMASIIEEPKPEPGPELVPVDPNEAAVSAVRAMAALEPLTPRERKLTLERAEERPRNVVSGSEGPSQAFVLKDPAGKEVAELFLGVEQGGKHLYVDDIRGVGGFGPNDLGPAAMRDILRQIKAEFPEAETIGGMRVSGARDKAGTWEEKGAVTIKLSEADPNQIRKVFQQTRGYIYKVGKVEAVVVPREQLIGKEVELRDEIAAIIDRLTAGRVRHDITDITTLEKRPIKGVYSSFTDLQPIILYSLAREDTPLSTIARHEVIHYLRDYGFIRPDEWALLEAEVEAKGWITNSIKEHYPEDMWVEEAVANKFGGWGTETAAHRKTAAKYSDKVGAIFERIKKLLDIVAETIREKFGLSVKVEDLFERIESGEVGQREPGERRSGQAALAMKEEQLELPQAGTTRMSERELFSKAAAIGMTVEQYKRYQKLIEKRRAEDAKWIADKVLEEERKHQTKEWKENYAKLREEVAQDISQRPDIATDNFLRAGHKLAADALTEEEKALLPKNYVAARGVHPDDIAGFFGYSSGRDLVDRLSQLIHDRAQTGMQPKVYQERVIDVETERRMQTRYGDLEANILEEAKEHVLSETQLDLLHEEMLALGLKADAELSITKEQVKAWVKNEFQNQALSAAKSDKYLAAAGRAGKNAEMHLLREEPADAFKFKQQQFIATIMAQEAKKLEKEVVKFDKLANRLRPRQVKAVEQEYLNFIHQLLFKAEMPVRRSMEDINQSIANDKNTNLQDFQEAKVDDGWEMDIADSVFTGPKPRSQMTVQEFQDFRDAVVSLNFIGRKVKQIEIKGKAEDFAEWKAQVLENLQELPPRAKEKQNRILYNWDASLTRMEEVVKDLDLRRQLGPMFNGIIRPMMDAKHKEYLLQEALAKELSAIKSHGKAWQKTLKESIPNDFFLDPDTGIPFDLSREHLINIMLNWGNRSNIDKFTRGWVGKDEAPAFEARMRQLIDQHATKEDWDFVQRMGDIFEVWRKEIDTLYYNLSGLAPKWLQIDPVDTPHGQYRGWYFPIIYDKYFSSIEVVKEKPDTGKDLLKADYFRATTANRHTRERTGYIDRVEFQNSIEQVATRMQQMMHDIAYRSAVMDVGKIIYDRQIREGIRKHYGQEYEAQLDPWLRDIANHFNQNEKANSAMNNALRRARMNLMGHALGLNLKVIGSPDVGALNPLAVGRVLSNYQASVDLAWAKSKEIPHTYRNMDRDFRERLERTIVKYGWDGVQADAVRWAFVPLVKVSQGFRIVTFVDQYKKAIANGMGEADAIALADSEVRLRHGSTGIPDLPAVMRGTEGMKMATMFYGFFNAMYNWQRGTAGQAKRGEIMKALETTYGAVVIPAIFGALLFNRAQQDESWWQTIGKALGLQMLGTLPLVRDLGSTIIEGFKPSTPIGSLFQAMASAYSDVKKGIKGQPIEKPIQHGANVIGLTFGLPLAQIGRTSQFISDVNRGKQRPKNIQEWVSGVIHGEAVRKR